MVVTEVSGTADAAGSTFHKACDYLTIRWYICNQHKIIPNVEIIIIQ